MKLATLYLVILLIVLNPYTALGKIGTYCAALVVFAFVISGRFRIPKVAVLGFSVTLAIGGFSLLTSMFHGALETGLAEVSVRIIVYFLVGVGIARLWGGAECDFDKMMVTIVWVLVLNSVVILLQVLYPEFRNMVENILVPSGNIDYGSGFRYRGLAAGGGAALSVTVPIGTALATRLYARGRWSWFRAAVAILIQWAAVLFIGRTGLLFIPLAIVLSLFGLPGRSARMVLRLGLVLGVATWVGIGVVETVTKSLYGDAFYRYSIGYFLEGREGFEREGTVSLVANDLTVLPTDWPQVLTGYGYYGTANIGKSTDSGYARMALAVGYVMALLYYIVISVIVIYVSRYNFWNILPVFAILLVVEIKEPLLLSGFGSRILFILLGFAAVTERSLGSARLPHPEVASI